MVIDAPEFAEPYPFLYATIGVHPHEASKATEATYDRMRNFAGNPKVLAASPDGGSPTLVAFDKEIAPGTRVR